MGIVIVVCVVWFVTAAVGALALGAALRLRDARTTPVLRTADATSRPAPHLIAMSGATRA
jgi:hypothetical protein